MALGCQEKTSPIDRKEEKEYPMITVDFLGYRFQPRMARNKHGKFFVSFLPAVSTKAKNKIRETIRGWRLHRMGRTSLKEVSEMINPVVRGWYGYYGRFYKTALLVVLRNVERSLILWVRWKYKRLRNHPRNALRFLCRVRKRMPNLFVHWQLGLGSATE
jgi:RNA-directed DNA polymerase